MKHARISLIAAVSLALSACGGEAKNETSGTVEPAASDQKTATVTDPCAAVSKEEVTAVTGETVLEATAEGDTCKYATDDDASSMEVRIVRPGGRAEMEVAKSAARALGAIGDDLKGEGGAQGDTGELLTDRATAPAIGDQAFFGPNRQLSVLKGDIYFAVSPPIMKSRMGGGNPLLSGEQRQAIAIEIATKIATKL